MEHNHQQYTCPMHPEVIKNAPGKCPKCGMQLIPLSASADPHAGHIHEHADQHMQQGIKSQGDEHSGHGGGHAHHEGMIEDFKKRFYVVLALTIPIMALSPMIQHWLNVHWTFSGSSYALMLLSTVSTLR